MQWLLSEALGIPEARCLAPDEVRGRMGERFTWAVSRGHAAVVLDCEPTGLAALERQGPASLVPARRALLRGLEPAFAAAEAVVETRARGWLVLLIGPDPARLEAACQAWTTGAQTLRVDGLEAPVRVGLRIGYAVTQPGKRQFLDTLLEVAREGLQVARCRGASACVHTRLYDLFQGRFERERGTPGPMVTASEPIVPGEPAREGQRAQAPVSETRPAAPPPATMARAASWVEPPEATSPAGPAARVDPDRERRERELGALLEIQRRENELLRARLQALESGLAPDLALGGVARLQPPDDDRVDRLERRLAKLVRSLEDAEGRLAEVSRARVEPGLPSVYRSVQGLDPDAPQHDLKVALMRDIFEANVRLRDQLRRA